MGQGHEAAIKALSERSSYVENVLRHALIASLSSVVWRQNPSESFEFFNSEVDASGFDVVFVLVRRERDGAG